jgi:hypothetical protein
MLRRLLNRFNLIQSTLLTTAMSVGISLAITMTAMIILDLQHMAFAATLAVICPMVIATPAAYHFLKLLVEIETKQNALEEANRRLEKALGDVRELSGLLPICSSCRKIRDDQGYWSQIETYIRKHTKADFSHGLCPGCTQTLYPDLDLNGLKY